MKALLTPRWIAAHLIVAVVAVVFVSLGFWQLRRLDERRLENSIFESRYLAPAEDFETLMAAAGGDFASLEFRRVTATGSYATQDEVLVRSQVFREQAGFHVVTPLVLESGGGVLVNRGWVPLPLDTPPVEEAPPPDGVVTVTGWIRTSQARPALGPADPEQGDLDVVNRVDIDRIQRQTTADLAPVYMVLAGTVGETLPVPIAPPTFVDEGSHLAYAIQWFGFTLIGIVGYGFLAKRALVRKPPGPV